jgi:hypothetical protein
LRCQEVKGKVWAQDREEVQEKAVSVAQDVVGVREVIAFVRDVGKKSPTSKEFLAIRSNVQNVEKI